MSEAEAPPIAALAAAAVLAGTGASPAAVPAAISPPNLLKVGEANS